MTRRLLFLVLIALPLAAQAQEVAEAPEATAVVPSEADGWIPLFNGEDLTGWTASENTAGFWVEDGLIVTQGKRSHLFYTGEVNDGVFKNFELWVEVKTEPKANSGIYFHTSFEDDGWPTKGYEVQVNQSHSDWRRTGGLYGIADVKDISPVKDGEWYSEHITVRGKRIVVQVNGEVMTDYTEPEGVERDERFAGRKIGEGTFALQCHDPGSLVRFRQIWVKPLD